MSFAALRSHLRIISLLILAISTMPAFAADTWYMVELIVVAQRHLIGERKRQLTHLLLILRQRDVVSLQLIAAVLERLDDGVDLRLRALEPHEVPLQRRSDTRNSPEQAGEASALQLEPRWIELLHLDP